uniref:Protein kinase domain-containing protein n=1 Tax=Macrostomum lignano TaxID=282301 RepID=A0A1I8FCK6_9PLAT
MHELGLLRAHPRRLHPSLFCPDASGSSSVLQSVVLFKSNARRAADQPAETIPPPTDLEMPESHTDTFLHLFHDLNICHKLNDKTLLFPTTWPTRRRAAGPGVRCRAESLQPMPACSACTVPLLPARPLARLGRRLHSTVADLKEARPLLLRRQSGARPAAAASPDSPARLPAAVLLLHRGGRLRPDSQPEQPARSAAGSASCSASGPSICCWRRGFMVKHDDGRFGIQLGDSGVELELCVLSQSRNFAPIGLLVDEVDLLLRHLVSRPGQLRGGRLRRPLCPSGYRTGAPRCTGSATDFCAERALTSGRCAALGAAPPRKSAQLVPELLFADVDRVGHCGGRNGSGLRREPDCLLGEGAFGSVYRACRLTSPSSCASCPGRRGSLQHAESGKRRPPPTRRPRAESAADSLVQLERARRLDQGHRRPETDARHEATPFLVAFRGICLRRALLPHRAGPPSALWLSVREEARKQRSRHRPAAGRQLKLQDGVRACCTATSSPTTLLVFSKDPAARLHVKLGDYGTSLNTGLQGTTRRQGGPGLHGARAVKLPLCLPPEAGRPWGQPRSRLVCQLDKQRLPATLLTCAAGRPDVKTVPSIPPASFITGPERGSCSAACASLIAESGRLFYDSESPVRQIEIPLPRRPASPTKISGHPARFRSAFPFFIPAFSMAEPSGPMGNPRQRYGGRVLLSGDMVLYELICGERLPFSKVPAARNLTKVVTGLDGGGDRAAPPFMRRQLGQQVLASSSPGAPGPPRLAFALPWETHSRWALERFIALPTDGGSAGLRAPVDGSGLQERDGGGIPDFVGAMRGADFVPALPK